MPNPTARLSVVVSILIATLLVASGAVDVAAKKKTGGTAATLRSLVVKTKRLPSKALPGAKRKGLLKAATAARGAARKRPCAAVRSLSRYRKILNGVKVRRGRRGAKAAARLTALGPLSLKASSSLLASRRTRRCGGGTAPSRLSHTTTTVLSSDANGMTVRVRLGKLGFVGQAGGGKLWTQLTLPDTDSPASPGKPGIPVASNVIGIPEGATVQVSSSHVHSYTLGGVKVYPAQPDPVDDAAPPNFDSPPYVNTSFIVDGKAYKAKGLQPPAPADGGIIGQSRDITIGDMTVPAVQYNAKSQKVKVLTSLIVNVVFSGGPHTFSDELNSPWERSQRLLAASLLNSSSIRGRLFELLRRCGMEILVITNPATEVAAQTLATARRAAGFRTSVVQTGSGTGQIGTTATEIQSYIRARLTAPKCIHPSYVVIMGDDELVPTFTDGPGGIPSDLKYSLRDDADELPDVAVGRILGADQAQVGTAVTKIVGYETSAPTGDFLTHALLAAQFQDDNLDGQENRTFSLFAETVRNGLIKRGVTVDRVYRDNPTANPLKFNDGTDVPAELQKPTFPWDGDAADISAGWNAGRFLIIHRDHGWSDGWGDPYYTTANVEALTNGTLLPVMMSINCSSAEYDNDETSFVQQALVKSDGGAVGIFGDTRVSPTWHNSQIGLGFVDGLLPSVLPAEGPAAAQRVGDALVNGKLRLAGLSPPTSDGNTRNELFLWHYFGDPSMQMWGGGHAPFVFDPSRFKAIFLEQIAPPGPGPEPEPPYQVVVTLPRELVGQPISLLQSGQVVGKAIAGDGSVTIPASFDQGVPRPGELQVAVEADGAEPVIVPVEGVPKGATTLQQSCPAFGETNTPLTVTGTLAGAPAGSTVEATFTPPSGSPTVVKAVADATGAWTASVTPSANQAGTWSIGSRFAETDQYLESKAGPCSVTVRPENF